MHLNDVGKSTTTEQRTARIRAQQVKLLYDSIPFAVIATLVISTALAVVQWPVIEHRIIVAWWGGILLVTLFRLTLSLAYKRAAPLTADTKVWENRFFLSVLSAGLLWGAAGVLLFPAQDVVGQAFLAFMLAGLTAGAVTSLSAMRRPILVFLTLSLVPLALRFFADGEPISITMGAMILFYLGVVAISARRFNDSVLESIALRVDNAPREEALTQNIRSLERLHAITGQQTLSFNDKIWHLLDVGTEIFGMPLAIVSHIKGSNYIVEHVIGSAHKPVPGTTFDFSETYCVDTLSADRPTSFHHVAEGDLRTHPGYQKFRLEAYIGAPIIVDGEPYGTLNFSSPEPREEPFNDNEHRLMQLFAQWIGSEITRKQVDEKRVYSEEKNKLILESVGEGVYGIGMDGKVTFVNPVAARLLGYAQDELIGEPMHEFIHHSRPDGSHCLWEESPMYAVFKDGDTHYATDEVLWRKDGTSFPIEYTSTPMRKNGELAGAVITFRDVTERVRSERKLNRFKNVLDDTMDMIFMFEPDTLRFVYVNRGAAASMGYSAQEMLQMKPYEIKPQMSEPEFRNFIAPLLAGELPSLSFETVHRRKNGSDFPVEIFLQFVKDQDNEGLFVAFVRDITERKQAQQKLWSQHKILNVISRIQSRFISETDPQQLFDDLLVDILSLTDSEYGFVGEILSTDDGTPYLKNHAITNIAWNPESQEFYEENAPQGLEFYNLETLFGAAITSGQPVISNSPTMDPRSGGLPPGHPVLNAFLGVPFFLGGKLIGMAGIANRPGGYNEELVEYLQPVLSACAQIIGALRNDKQRMQALESLQESATRIRAIVDTVVDGIITINDQGLVESFNPAAERIFGYTSAEVVGHNVKMLMPEPYCGEHDRYLENYSLSGDAQIIGIGREVEGLRKDGTTFPLELAVSEMQLGDQRMFTGIVRDITERKKVERMKNEFVSTVSHELRTPLTSIRGSLGLIAGGATGELPEQTRNLIDIAHRNSGRLIYLINDILDMEKIASGKMKFDLQIQELSPLIEQALEINRAYVEEYGVSLELADVPRDIHVNVDSERLLQVLSNLLSNAAKFSPFGGQVDVTVTRHDSSVRILVVDRGQGIPEGFRERIFHKFSQADASDTRRKGGTGLGLSISKSIIENMGGSIGFETQTGVGTTFYLDLAEAHGQVPESDCRQFV